MGVLVKRTGAPIGSFEELAASAEHKACKRENEREGEERAAVNLMTSYDLPTLKEMLAISERRSNWVGSAVPYLMSAFFLPPLLWRLLTQERPPAPCWVAAGAFVLAAFLLYGLLVIQRGREELIKRAIRMHEEDVRRLAAGGEGGE